MNKTNIPQFCLINYHHTVRRLYVSKVVKLSVTKKRIPKAAKQNRREVSNEDNLKPSEALTFEAAGLEFLVPNGFVGSFP